MKKMIVEHIIPLALLFGVFWLARTLESKPGVQPDRRELPIAKGRERHGAFHEDL